MKSAILKKTENSSFSSKAVMICLDHWKDYPAGEFMTVGILVPGQAFWEEKWKMGDGWLGTTLQDTPECVYTQYSDVTSAAGFWRTLASGDIVIADSPFYHVLSAPKDTPSDTVQNAVRDAIETQPSMFPDGWVDSTAWHDDWIPVDRKLLLEADAEDKHEGCPFCGAKEAAQVVSTDNGLFRIVCTKCHVNGVASRTEEGAWKEWHDMSHYTETAD